jgi:putative phosphoesterase
MIIGLIADIHGNLQALATVLRELYAQHVDLILCAGDLVCYGAHPNHVIALLRQCAIPSVTGNYDAAVAWKLPTAARKPSSPQTEPLKQAALEWTKQEIHTTHRDYLRSLPWSMNFQLDGQSIHMMHAGPKYLDEWLTPEEPAELAYVAAAVNADIVVLAHTHQAYIHKVENPLGHETLFINPGAVGRSLDGDTRAAYALLDTATGSAQLHRVAYDLDIAVRAILRSGMPPGIAMLVRHGARRIEQLSPSILAQTGIEKGIGAL